MAELIAIGKIVGAHGIRGEVTIQPYNTDTIDDTLFRDVTDKHGKNYRLKITGHKKLQLIAAIKEVTTRTIAEGMRGLELYISRDKLPATEEGEYYYEDLIGLKALNPDRSELGKVTAMVNYGAGDIIEIELLATGNREMLSFVDAVVPEICISDGYVVVVMPEIESERDGEV